MARDLFAWRSSNFKLKTRVGVCAFIVAVVVMWLAQVESSLSSSSSSSVYQLNLPDFSDKKAYHHDVQLDVMSMASDNVIPLLFHKCVVTEEIERKCALCRRTDETDFTGRFLEKPFKMGNRKVWLHDTVKASLRAVQPILTVRLGSVSVLVPLKLLSTMESGTMCAGQ